MPLPICLLFCPSLVTRSDISFCLLLRLNSLIPLPICLLFCPSAVDKSSTFFNAVLLFSLVLQHFSAPLLAPRNRYIRVSVLSMAADGRRHTPMHLTVSFKIRSEEHTSELQS